jgi:hypothetical protein
MLDARTTCKARCSHRPYLTTLGHPLLPMLPAHTSLGRPRVGCAIRYCASHIKHLAREARTRGSSKGSAGPRLTVSQAQAEATKAAQRAGIEHAKQKDDRRLPTAQAGAAAALLQNGNTIRVRAMCQKCYLRLATHMYRRGPAEQHHTCIP